MEERYTERMKKLKLYLKVVNMIPSQQQWNSYAMEEGLLLSQTLEFLEGVKFNRMCRKLIKKRK